MTDVHVLVYYNRAHGTYSYSYSYVVYKQQCAAYHMWIIYNPVSIPLPLLINTNIQLKLNNMYIHTPASNPLQVTHQIAPSIAYASLPPVCPPASLVTAWLSPPDSLLTYSTLQRRYAPHSPLPFHILWSRTHSRV